MRGLTTARLTLRPFVADDAQALEAVLGDAEVMRFSDTGALDADAIARWLADQIAQAASAPDRSRWAVTRHGHPTPIGYVGLTRSAGRTGAGEAELGFRLAAAHWGRGYATEAARALLRHASAEAAIERVIAIVDPHNIASVRVVQKLGLTWSGTIMFEGYDHPDHVYRGERPALAKI